jgi:hypothetical protein
MTYARRYSYMAVLGLVADEDDDGNAASKPKPMFAKKEPAVANTLPVELQTKLGNAVKLKGITDKQKIVNVLNSLAWLRYQEHHFTKITEDEATELIKAIRGTSSEELGKLA